MLASRALDAVLYLGSRAPGPDAAHPVRLGIALAPHRPKDGPMPKPVPLGLAAALLTVPAGAHVDSTTARGAVNAAQLRGYTASPAQLYVPADSPAPPHAAPAPRRPKAPARGR